MTATTECCLSGWRAQAACLDEDPEMFYPVGSTGPSLDQIQRAKAICHRCPVITECLDWAMATKQEAGIWGGLTEDERRTLRRTLRRRRPHGRSC